MSAPQTTAEIEAQDEAARAANARLHAEVPRADPATLRLLLTEARTHNGWQDKPVTDAQLAEIIDLMKWGPTSMNQQPARFVFVRSAEAKARLKPHLAEGNVVKTMAAPVTAIVCYDLAFYERMPEVFPARPNAREIFAGKDDLIQANATLNGALQGAYFIIAARAIGLDCGPMTGFNRAGVDAEFLAGTTFKSSFLCNLGYGDPARIFRRMPRLGFEAIAKVV